MQLYFISLVQMDDHRKNAVSTTCAGYFSVLLNARSIITHNIDDLQSGNYDYAVIEVVDHDRLTPIHQEVAWYEWSKDKGRFMEIPEKPSSLKDITNFALN